MMIRHNHYLKSRRGQVLTEQVFVLAAIVGIALIVVARIGFETSSVFDQLGRTFPRFSNSRSGRQPAGKRPKRTASTPTATAPNGAPAAATAPSTAAKAPGARGRRGSGGGGLSQSKGARDTKRGGTVSWGVTSTISTGSGMLAVLIGR